MTTTLGATELLAPEYAAFQEQINATSMRCFRYAPIWGVSAATKIACGFGLRASTTGGCAVYPDNDSSNALASASGSVASVNMVSATGLTPFTILADTVYRWCICNTNSLSAGVGVYGAANQTATLLNSFASNTMATAANNCASGVPPATTGVLTGVSNQGVPIVYVSQ